MAQSEWQFAMAEEIAALERTGTWDLVSPPPGVRPITCKWVYKIKTHSDGSLERYKARLVARGFQQEQGRDYDETFAPVAHMTTVRTLLVVASVRHWSVRRKACPSGHCAATACGLPIRPVLKHGPRSLTYSMS